MFGTQVKYYELWFTQLLQIISKDFAVYIWTNYWERAVPPYPSTHETFLSNLVKYHLKFIGFIK